MLAHQRRAGEIKKTSERRDIASARIFSLLNNFIIFISLTIFSPIHSFTDIFITISIADYHSISWGLMILITQLRPPHR